MPTLDAPRTAASTLLDERIAELAAKYLPLAKEILAEAIRIPADYVEKPLDQGGDPLCGTSNHEFPRLEYLRRKILEIKAEEVREALAESVNQVVEAAKIALERTPPELAADIVDKGIVLVGGGAQLRNLDVLLREATGLPVMLAEDPLNAVAIGTGRTLDELPLLREVAHRS